MSEIKEGDVYETECIGTGKSGDGICKVEGFVIIVPGAKPDNTYKFKVTKVKEKFGFGEIIS